jgi:hypothetical protein
MNKNQSRQRKKAHSQNRKGYVSSKPNIKAIYPFVDDGIVKSDVERILQESGLGLPEYYNWRSRSGCYFCFFQQRIEWVGLLENHPDLYKRDWQALIRSCGQTPLCAWRRSPKR